MKTQEFLEVILPHEGVCLIAYKTDKGFRHMGFDKFESAAEFALQQDSKGIETYHACASYKSIPYKDDNGVFIARKSVNWSKARSFWADIDCGADKAAEGKGYPTQKEGATALLQWCKAHNFPKPLLVNSGYGVHAYWPMTDALEAPQWERYAKALKAAFERDGLIVDPARTADFASILRPAGTHNHKHGDERTVICADAFVTTKTEELLNLIEALGTLEEERPSYLDNAEVEQLPQSFRPQKYSAVECAKHCKQIRIMAETKGDVGYETWRGVIGIIKHCEEGIDLAREWTENRAEKHEQTDYEVKFNTWDSGPTTCEFFEKACPEHCKGCLCKGKVNTPLMLGRIEPEQAKVETVEARLEAAPNKVTKLEVPPLPKGYSWTGSELVRYFRDKDGVLVPVAISNTLFYLYERVRNSEGTYEFRCRAHLPKGLVREFNILGSDIGTGGATLTSVLGAQEIFMVNSKDSSFHLNSYLKDYVRQLTETTKVRNTYSSFGWQPDGGFLIGTRLYSPDGSETEVLLSSSASCHAVAFPRPSGTIEAYAKQVNWIYNRKGMEAMQYMMCSLWAAPLAELSDITYNGIPCALTGPSSGKGKTTAAIVALYAFGKANPELTIVGKDGVTAKGQAKFIGTLRNLPVLFDEVTNKNSKQLSELCYALSNGVEAMRLKSTGGEVSFGDREHWRTHTAMTGNADIGAALSQNGNTEAEAMRVFEIHVDDFLIPELDPVSVSTAVSEVARNSGVAGEAYIKYLVSKRSEVIDLLKESLEEISTDQDLVGQPRYRFYRNHMACTLTAAKIMKELKVIDFDIDRLRNFAIVAVRAIFDRVAEGNVSTNYSAVLARMLMDIGPRIVTTPTLTPVGTDEPYRVSCPLGLVGRSIKANSAKKDEHDGKLLISISAINDWCAEKRVDKKCFAAELTRLGLLKSIGDRFSIGKGTTMTSAQQRCWVLDAYKIEEIGGFDNEKVQD